MAMRKIDIWKLVSEAEIPDELTVDPMEVLCWDRHDSPGLFDEQDKKQHDEYFKLYGETRLKLNAALNEEQRDLYDKASEEFAAGIGVELFSSYKFGFRDGVLLMFNTLLRAGLKDGHEKGELSELEDTVLRLAK